MVTLRSEQNYQRASGEKLKIKEIQKETEWYSWSEFQKDYPRGSVKNELKTVKIKSLFFH